VVRRHLQLQAGKRGDITASGVYPQLPILTCESGQVCGQTYNDAQGVFAVKSLPQPDGRVRLELVPELQHDQPRRGGWAVKASLAWMPANQNGSFTT